MSVARLSVTSRAVRVAALGAAFLVVSTGCSSGSAPASAGCAKPLREALDSRSLQHVLPGATPPTYLSDPPTSGPHQPSPPIHGLRTEPIPAPQQVGLLEGGAVLIQYRGLTAAELDEVRSLVGEHVVVAPATELPDGNRIVGTAWLQKVTCRSVDLPALRRFVTAHTGHGPGHS